VNLVVIRLESAANWIRFTIGPLSFMSITMPQVFHEKLSRAHCISFPFSSSYIWWLFKYTHQSLIV
jgi:hypothetical protein